MLPTISPDHQHKIHYLPARSDITNPPPSHRPLPPIKARIQRGCAEVADESAPIPIRLAFWNGREFVASFRANNYSQTVRPLSWRAHR